LREDVARVGPASRGRWDRRALAQLLGAQHQAVREARAFSREARVRELARLEAEVARLRESLH
jgi:hypothetical protein